MHAIMERLPSASELFGAFLSFAIPFVIKTVNRKIHQYTDPPWKKQQ